MITEGGSLQKVAGFQLRTKHVIAFTAYMNLLDLKDVAAVTGQEIQTIRSWSQTKWWKELEKQHMDNAFRHSSLKLNHMVENNVIPFLERAMTTEGLDRDEIALLNAKSGVAKMIMSLGNKPLMRPAGNQSNPNTIVNVNTQVNGENTTLNIDKLRTLTPEQKHRIALGEPVPQDITADVE